ncbi:hypothetical protein K1T35_17410 [Pseudonocardia sp. DSM 110487]|uniref:hypothetical protein n=1 Tax=Pseudonocardia sp. DSM 110487 TaxID=2865833 RepID=UPI001C69BD88|nr:hypothetical protein [Pseudonocardia sp. DSM 110487]QYN38822.1 hypothetical protein K1T35_17410 [Pseudonocardia sp. DSM 110487]
MHPTPSAGSVGSRIADMLRAVGVTVDGASRHSRLAGLFRMGGQVVDVGTSREGGIGG